MPRALACNSEGCATYSHFGVRELNPQGCWLLFAGSASVDGLVPPGSLLAHLNFWLYLCFPTLWGRHGCSLDLYSTCLVNIGM